MDSPKLSQQTADMIKKLFNQWYNEVGATLVWGRGGEGDTGFETFLDGLVSEDATTLVEVERNLFQRDTEIAERLFIECCNEGKYTPFLVEKSFFLKWLDQRKE